MLLARRTAQEQDGGARGGLVEFVPGPFRPMIPAMPELTRRQNLDHPDCWHIHFGDVRIGTISKAVGTPNNETQWRWICGFYPGCEPGEYRNGSEPDFERARAAFEAAWRALSATRTEADYQAYRDDRDWHARKYAAWDRGEKVPRR